MSVPNLKRRALFVQKLLGGPKIMKLGHVTPATPLRGRLSYTGRLRPVCLYQIWSGSLFSFKSY